MAATKNRNSKKVKRNISGLPPSILQWSGLSRPPVLGFYVLLALVVASGLSVVRTTHQNRFTFSQLQELRDEANNLDVQWGQLLIEQSTFGLEGRIEQKAVEQLQMQVPELNNIVMVKND